jgi:nucleoid-associated protein YgaU
MDCPVCQNSQIEEGASSCSGCRSDLSAFTHLKAEEKERNGLRKSRLILFIVLGLVLVSWAGTYATRSPEGPPAAESELLKKTTKDKDRQISELKAKIEEQQSKIEQLESELTGLLTSLEKAADKEGNVTMHVVQKGETLWKISEKYHGNGLKHTHIAEHNKMDQPHYLKVGDTILIKHK